MRFAILFALVATFIVGSIGRSEESRALPTAHPTLFSNSALICESCDKSNGCASKRIERLEHLLKAVEHLEAAGLQTEADLIRRQMDGEIKALIQNLKPATTACSHCCPDTKSAKQISIQFEVIEVSLTKLRNLGIDFAFTSDDKDSRHAVFGEAIKESTVITDAQAVRKFFEALRRENLAKVLAEPTILTQSGERACFVSAGEIPSSSSPGKTGVQIEAFPVVQEKGKIHLEMSLELDEPRLVHDDADQQASTDTHIRAKTKLDLNDGQVAILQSPIHRKTVTVSKRVGHGIETEKQEFATWIIVYPTIEQ